MRMQEGGWAPPVKRPHLVQEAPPPQTNLDSRFELWCRLQSEDLHAWGSAEMLTHCWCGAQVIPKEQLVGASLEGGTGVRVWYCTPKARTQANASASPLQYTLCKTDR